MHAPGSVAWRPGLGRGPLNLSIRTAIQTAFPKTDSPTDSPGPSLTPSAEVPANSQRELCGCIVGCWESGDLADEGPTSGCRFQRCGLSIHRGRWRQRQNLQTSDDSGSDSDSDRRSAAGRPFAVNRLPLPRAWWRRWALLDSFLAIFCTHTPCTYSQKNNPHTWL